MTLLPCPFCGGESQLHQTGQLELTLKCIGPNARTGLGCGVQYKQRVLRQSLDWLSEQMTQTWNARAQPPQGVQATQAGGRGLLPCPKGHPAEYDCTGFSGDNVTEVSVQCTVCEWRNGDWPSKEAAAEAWNTRASAPSAQALREALERVTGWAAKLPNGDYTVPGAVIDHAHNTLTSSTQQGGE